VVSSPHEENQQESEEDKMTQGRPTKYKPEYDDQARRLCLLLGATNEQLAEYFDVNPDTVYEWMNTYPSFSESIKEGKLSADATVAASLFKRATGYTGKKVVTASAEGKITDTQTVDDYIGPDTAACRFWLNNRQSAAWRDKSTQEHTGANGGPIAATITLTPEDAYKKMLDGGE
jgi:transposase-like protein